MRVVAWDTETHLIKPGCLAPRLVCLSFSEDGKNTELLDREQGLAWLHKNLDDPFVTLVAHHAPFDLGVAAAEDPSLLPKIFREIDARRLTCTKLREMIICNAKGELKFEYDEELEEFKKQSFTLERIAWHRMGIEVQKGEDTWRLRYRELDGIPLAKWPPEARDYACFDSALCWRVWNSQRLETDPEGIPGEGWQMEAAWALQLVSIWGLRCDPDEVAKVGQKFKEEFEKALEVAQEHGFVRDNKQRSKNLAAIREAVEKNLTEQGKKTPKTAKGSVSTARDTLKKTGHPGLLAVAEMGVWQKLLTTYLPILEQGTEHPINPSYNPILETFRTSCARPNIQNQPRKGGVRECYAARDGWAFVFCDYDTLELRSLAQVNLDLFGESAMAEALREGKDLHLDMAAEIAGIEYPKAVSLMEEGDSQIQEFRQHSKPANFGFPGGMGAQKFVDYAAGYGIKLSLEAAEELRRTFMRKWPEMRLYFAYCANLIDGEKASSVTFLRSEMVRGDVMYTAVCNGFFQHLAAMGAKQALYEVTKECYTGNTALRGSRPIGFIHDEIGIETPDNKNRAAAAERLEQVMIKVMKRWITDIPITCGSVMMYRWFKGAKPVYDKRGRLVPCQPQKLNGKTIWVTA